MKQVITNTFEILNLPNLNFSYKLIGIAINGLGKGQEKEWNKALEKSRSGLATHLQTVAVPLFVEGKPYLAIPANKSLTEPLIVDTNPLPATLTEIQGVHQTFYGTGNPEKDEIVFRFLDFAIKEQLGNKKLLGSVGSYDFIEKDNWDSINGVDTFQGFSYRMVHDNGFSIVPDVSCFYIDQLYVSDIVNIENVNFKKKQFIGQRFLYFNGDNWYPIEIKGFAESIDTQKFKQQNGQYAIVQDYILERNKNSRFDVKSKLSPEHLSLLHIYPGRKMEPHIGATSLAKRILKTDDVRVQSLHRKSIKLPFKRFGEIDRIIKKHFQNLYFNGELLDISTTPKTENLQYFNFPGLKFRGNRILKEGSPKKDGGKIKLIDIPKFRKIAIERCGILKQGRFSPQYLFVPNNWDKSLAKVVHQIFHRELKKLATEYVGIDDFKLVTWKFNPTLSVSEQIDEIKKSLEKAGDLSGYGLFVLPSVKDVTPNYLANFHDLLKQKFEEKLWFQCASTDSIANFFQSYYSKTNNSLIEYKLKKEKERDFKSYMSYLAMEFFTLQRKWAYALEKPLNYDIYIGMDSGGRNVGFTIFFRNGEDIFYSYITVPRKSKNLRTERLSANKIVEKILPILQRRISSCAPNPNGIVFVKDGKSYGEPSAAIKIIIDELGKKELINKDNFKWGVIDLHKKSATPLRMALPLNNSFEKLENPRTGAYRIYDKLPEVEGFLFNTGYPFRIRGSVKPLQYILRDGNIDFHQALKDLYDQSMMPFSAPNLSNKLPACIKLIDSFLGHTGTAYDERKFREANKEQKVASHLTN